MPSKKKKRRQGKNLQNLVVRWGAEETSQIELSFRKESEIELLGQYFSQALSTL